MSGYQNVTNSVSRFFAAVDNKDWEAAAQLMTSPIRLDYSSFGAGPAKDLEPKEVLDGWKKMLLGLDNTQHNLGPLDIEMNGAQRKKCLIKCCVVGVHYLDGAKDEGLASPLWNVYGDYRIELNSDGGDGGAELWKISSLTLLYKFQTGNTSIPKLAQEKSAEILAGESNANA